MLDVATAAQYLGVSEKAIRARIARRLLPHRRLGSRVVIPRADLEAFLAGLDGCDPEEAIRNVAAQRGR